jgi:hypothetical protein
VNVDRLKCDSQHGGSDFNPIAGRGWQDLGADNFPIVVLEQVDFSFDEQFHVPSHQCDIFGRSLRSEFPGALEVIVNLSSFSVLAKCGRAMSRAGSDKDSMRPESAWERRPSGFLTRSGESSGPAKVDSIREPSDEPENLRRSIAVKRDRAFVYAETMP